MKKYLFIAILFFAYPSLLFGAVSVGSEVQVAASLSDGQRNPQIAFDGTDTYLVVWEQGEDVWSQSVKKVYAARIKIVAGVPTAQDASGILVSSSSYSQRLPKVDYSEDQNCFLVVWQELMSGTDWGIRGMRIDPDDGSTLDAGGITISNPSHNQINPDVIYDTTNNRFFVMWLDFRSATNYNVYGAQVNASSGAVSGETLMYEYTGATALSTAIQLDVTTDGTYIYASWFEGANPDGQESSDQGYTRDYRANRYDMDGTLSGSISADNGSTFGDFFKTVQSGNNGPYHNVKTVVHNTYGLFFDTHYNPANNSQVRYQFLGSAPFTTSSAINTGSIINIDPINFTEGFDAIYKNDKFWVFYQGVASFPNYYSDTIDYNIYAGKISLDGTVAEDYSAPIAISAETTIEQNPVVADGPGNNVMVAYEVDSNLDGDDYYDKIVVRLVGTIITAKQTSGPMNLQGVGFQ